MNLGYLTLLFFRDGADSLRELNENYYSKNIESYRKTSDNEIIELNKEY